MRVSAELPGLNEKDVEVLMEDGGLTIRGEKKSEVDDKERQFSERYYGRFERRIPLGFEVEADKVAAEFKNGVLSVTLPKSAKAQANAKRASDAPGLRDVAPGGTWEAKGIAPCVDDAGANTRVLANRASFVAKQCVS